jgi:hypothetical protein
MKKSLAMLGAVLAFALALAYPRDAHALGPIDLEIGAKLGYATDPSSGNTTINPMGLGIGARAGIVFLGGVYAGANFMYYTGGSDVGDSLHTILYGLEAGYGLKLAILTIRPQVGVGIWSLSVSPSSLTAAPSTSYSHLYVQPGVTALISLGMLYLGADVGLLLIPGLENGADPNNPGQQLSKLGVSVTFGGQIGVKF